MTKLPTVKLRNPGANSSRDRPMRGDLASKTSTDSIRSSIASAAFILSCAIYVQICFRSRFAASERLTLANSLQLPAAQLFSGFGFDALHVQLGDTTIVNIV